MTTRTTTMRRLAELGLLALALGLTSTVAAQDPEPPFVLIPEIQGETHVSPYLFQRVKTGGVVTALAFNGYYIQDPLGDGNPRTSDGIFVFTGGSPSVSVGDKLELEDTVTEFIPGGAGTGNLSITQLSFPRTTVLSTGNPLPAPVILGRGGFIPRARIVISESEIDPPINLQDAADAAANRFNPGRDGIDFYEAVEGMRVKVEEPTAVSATRTFSPFSSEFVVLANDGADVQPFNAQNARGGIDLQPDLENRGDQNPERVQIQIDATLYPGPVPVVKVGDRLSDVVGVVGYSFGNFEVNAVELIHVVDGGLEAEVTHLGRLPRRLTVASYNVLNLSPDASDDNQRATLARHIVHNLRSPDIVALQEIQDNSGETDDGTVDADETLQALVDAIRAAGGPEYRFLDGPPEDGASGGIPGGNIRNAYIWNPHRAELIYSEILTPDNLRLAGVTNPLAFQGTRDPFAAKFRFRGEYVWIVNNHLTSRFGSTPIFGGPQPFVQAGEEERSQETTTLREWVEYVEYWNPNANVIVCGDLNTFEFTDDILFNLQGAPFGPNKVLFNLIGRLFDDEVYTFNFEGNSQVLDHGLVNRNLRFRAVLDIVHTNVDFPRVDDTFGSDHEPLLMSIRLGRPGYYGY
ncbi:MAG: endonuclease/exonuclease/phosphatase family protein [Sandaracinaceae bacterium]